MRDKRQLQRTYMERVSSARVRRELAALCPPHPRTQIYLTKGDYSIPVERRCGRCGRRVDDDATIGEGT